MVIQGESGVKLLPDLNCSSMTVRVDIDTLKVEFWFGYAGVIIGIR